MSHWRRVLLGLLFALMLAPVFPAGAVATVSEELAVNFNASGATADYPRGITFSLDYDTDEPIERAELFYTTSGEETLNLVTPKILGLILNKADMKRLAKYSAYGSSEHFMDRYSSYYLDKGQSKAKVAA